MNKIRFYILTYFLLWGTILFSQSDSLNPILIDTYSLEELINMKITTANRSEQKIEDVSANVEIITEEEIAQYGFKNLEDILQHITGIYKVEDYYWLGSTNYGIRGYFKTGPFSNVSILINGVNQVSDKYSDFPDTKITLPVEAIERIEVIKGPMAVVYGNGAFFGVINIITNDSQVHTNKIITEQATTDKRKIFAQFTGGNTEFNYKYSVAYDYDYGLDIPYTDITSDTSLLEYVGLQADSRTGGQLSSTRYYAGVNLNYKKIRLDFSYNQSDKGVFDGLPSYNNGNNLKTQAVNTSLQYKETIGNKISMNGIINYYTHNHTLNYEVFRTYYYEIDAQTTNALSAEINIDYNPTTELSFTGNISRRTVLNILQISDFGYYGLNYGDGKSGLPKDEHYSTTGGYMQAQYKAFDKFTTIAGCRIEHLESYNMYVARGVLSEDPADNRNPDDSTLRYVIESTYMPDNNGFTFTPRISFIYNPFPKHFCKLMYSEARKQPSFSENYRQLPEKRPQLSASQIQTLEINYYTYSIRNTIINASFFINKLDNLIENTNIFNKETNEWEFYSTNSGKYLTQGIEGQIIIKPTKKLEFDTRVLFQKTTDLRDGYKNIAVAYSPAFIGYFNIYYHLFNSISLAANIRYIDSMKAAWKTDSTPENGYRIGIDSPENIVVNCNILAENLFKKNIFAGLKINNILNSEIRYPTTKSNVWIDKGAKENAINANISLGIKF